MNTLLVTLLGIGILICLTGYWIERLIKIWYQKRLSAQEQVFLNITDTIKSLYDYFLEEVEENEQTKQAFK